jgi:hypothetical protein
VVDGGTTSCRVDQLVAVLYPLLFVFLTYTHYAPANQNLRGGGLVGGAGWQLARNVRGANKGATFAVPAGARPPMLNGGDGPLSGQGLRASIKRIKPKADPRGGARFVVEMWKVAQNAAFHIPTATAAAACLDTCEIKNQNPRARAVRRVARAFGLSLGRPLGQTFTPMSKDFS